MVKSNKQRVYRRVQQPKAGKVVTGKPDAEKLACPVWEGAIGNVSDNRQRAGRLLHTSRKVAGISGIRWEKDDFLPLLGVQPPHRCHFSTTSLRDGGLVNEA